MNKLHYGLLILFSGSFILLCGNIIQKFPSDIKDESTVIAAKFCEGMEAMNKNSVRPFLTDTTVWVDLYGTVRPYMRAKNEMAEFEKRTNSIWAYEILCSNNNVVTVVSKETGDFYKLLDLGAKIQVLDLHIHDGKVTRIVLKASTTYNSSQDIEYSKFKKWLFSQKRISEPELMKPDFTLHFNGTSAPRMVFWLQKWRHYSDSISVLQGKQ